MAKIKLKQIGSPIRRPESQKKILIGLGLGKMHRVVEPGEFDIMTGNSSVALQSTTLTVTP